MNLDLNGLNTSSPITKVSPAPAATVQNVGKHQNPTPAPVPAPSVTADRTTFQSDSTSLKTLVSTALATPDVRQDKVDSLSLSMANGTWKFDAGKVADAMIAASKQS